MTWQTANGPLDFVSPGLWECANCKERSSRGDRHREDCPNHPQARLFALERRVKALEERLAQLQEGFR